jgi:hypothetical protein
MGQGGVCHFGTFGLTIIDKSIYELCKVCMKQCNKLNINHLTGINKQEHSGMLIF